MLTHRRPPPPAARLAGGARVLPLALRVVQQALFWPMFCESGRLRGAEPWSRSTTLRAQPDGSSQCGRTPAAAPCRLRTSLHPRWTASGSSQAVHSGLTGSGMNGWSSSHTPQNHPVLRRRSCSIGRMRLHVEHGRESTIRSPCRSGRETGPARHRRCNSSGRMSVRWGSQRRGWDRPHALRCRTPCRSACGASRNWSNMGHVGMTGVFESRIERKVRVAAACTNASTRYTVTVLFFRSRTC